MTQTVDVGTATVQFIRRSMGVESRWSTCEERGFTWWGHRLAQQVWADPPQDDNGIEVCKVHARVTLLKGFARGGSFLTRIVGRNPRGSVPPLTLQRLSVVNWFASHSALVWDPVERRVSLHACAFVNEMNLESMQRYLLSAAILQSAEAEAKLDELVELFPEARSAASDHPRSGRRVRPAEVLNSIDSTYAPAGAGASPYGQRSFAIAADTVRGLDCVGQADEDGLVFEVPVRGQGRPSITLAAAGQYAGPPETAVVVAQNQVHPVLGNGTLLRLRLPLDAPDFESASRLANRLNLAEVRGWSRSPLVGAWCARGSHVLFVTFLPAHGHDQALPAAVCSDLAVKAKWGYRIGGPTTRTHESTRGRLPQPAQVATVGVG